MLLGDRQLNWASYNPDGAYVNEALDGPGARDCKHRLSSPAVCERDGGCVWVHVQRSGSVNDGVAWHYGPLEESDRARIAYVEGDRVVGLVSCQTDDRMAVRSQP